MVYIAFGTALQENICTFMKVVSAADRQHFCVMARPASRNLHFGPNFARLWIFMVLVKFRQTGKKRNRSGVTLSQTVRSAMYHHISRVQWLQCASCGLRCAAKFALRLLFWNNYTHIIIFLCAHT